jgi:hypothetical protein
MTGAASKLPPSSPMLHQHQEAEMTELDERITSERERAELLKRQMACGCPDRCDVDHDN